MKQKYLYVIAAAMEVAVAILLTVVFMFVTGPYGCTPKNLLADDCRSRAEDRLDDSCFICPDSYYESLYYFKPVIFVTLLAGVPGIFVFIARRKIRV